MVTLTAIAVFAGQHAYRLNSAEREFEYAQALWDVGRVDLGALLIAERNLFEVESDVPWIPQRRAVGDHIGRLEGILDRAQARFEVTLWGGTDEAYEAYAKELKRFKAETAALRARAGL